MERLKASLELDRMCIPVVYVLFQLLHADILHEILPRKYLWKQSLLCFLRFSSFHSVRTSYQIHISCQRLQTCFLDIVYRRSPIHAVFKYADAYPSVPMLESYGCNNGVQYGIYQCTSTFPNLVSIHSLRRSQPVCAHHRMLCTTGRRDSTTCAFYSLLISNCNLNRVHLGSQWNWWSWPTADKIKW